MVATRRAQGSKDMGKSIYIINPQSDFPSYYGADVFLEWGIAPTISVADLAVTTVAGLVPRDFDVCICDEQHSPIRYNAAVDYVAITGKVSQQGRMAAIAAEFRRRGTIVIVGGPYA